MQTVLRVIGILVTLAFFQAGPASSQNQVPTDTALANLEGEGIAFSVGAFLRRAETGDTKRVKWFLDAGMDADAVDKEARTALQLASGNQHWDAVELLLSRGADPMLALKGITKAKSNDWVQNVLVPLGSYSPALLAVAGLWFTHRYNQSQQRLAAQKSEESQRLQLIEATEKMIPHLQNSEGPSDAALITLLNLADSEKLVIALAELYPSRAAAKICIETLLRKERPPEQPEEVERALWGSLYEAAGQVGEVGVIELIDRLGEKRRTKIVNRTDAQGRTALMKAASHNRGGNIKELIDRGATIDARDVGGETALHYAARWGNRDALNRLLDGIRDSNWDDEKKASFFERVDPPKRTALQLARRTAVRPPDPNMQRAYNSVVHRLEREHKELGLPV